MNTERLAVLLLGLLLLSCSNSEDGPVQLPVDEGVTTQYALLLSSQGKITQTELEANAVDIHPTSGNHDFLPIDTPDLTYRDGNTFSFLHEQIDCGVDLSYWDPASGNLNWESIFEDLPGCDRQLLAIAHSPSAVYVGYSLPGSGMKEVLFYLRFWSKETGSASLGDIAIEKEPLQLLWSGNRLFVLTYDIETGKNSLQVLDSQTGTVEDELDLGLDVLKIMKTISGQLLISYQSRHLLLDATNLEVVSRVQYIAGKEPHFGESGTNYFDPSGLLYYAMPTGGEGTEIPHITGVYNFSDYTAYLYYYENFLSPERIAQYAIGDTRTVAFDAHNGLILIGYEKSGTGGKGGLLRIKPVPEPKFIDQINLDGIPEQLIVY